MRVLFVNPHYPHDPFTLLLHPPLCYAYMSTHLKAAGHEVRHADLPFLGNTLDALGPILADYRPDLVGVTSVAQSYCQALEIAAAVKNSGVDAKVVFGGPHVTFLPTECLTRHADVDYVLLYDAEQSIVELCAAIGPGRAEEAALRKVSGLAFRTDAGSVALTPPAPPLMALDELGRPDRSIFDLAPYLAYDYETVVMTARGCPSRCTFCSTTIAGRKPRWNSPVHVVDEMEEVAELGFQSIFFGDDTFSGDPKRAIAISAEIRARGLDLPWTSNMRAQDAKPAVLEAMREAGAYRVFMGFESIQKATLRLIKKGATPERMIEKARLVMDAGLELHASFIIGAPGDTDETLAATLDYIRLLNPTVATFNVMEPRPGTDVFSRPEQYGIEIPDRYWYESTGWLYEPVCRTTTLTSTQIRDWVDQCYMEFCSPDFRAPERLATLDDATSQWRSSGLVEPVAG
ncbi:B12-binding domain-containing radical SAM protein [Micromonospora sagamiensis]|uniref:Anaerobic magnesium-protoporphyrin IX monomethyl ester cyclase n=1 Tax=Micromonospora sagamiensis TaxID=47875 RepID=A0A562WJE2_9ACTN|nr:radical SAM protein [Micromonospora sagamiensis]TWJ30305.1 anaerobic magnesium-protoporphyrin IX monomethyl ester cyclase [Micromonospora sagamiensis]BCL16665.1 B12-binding domain-containing radical SAM protein [Micromonospora sagamiensis]